MTRMLRLYVAILAAIWLALGSAVAQTIPAGQSPQFVLPFEQIPPGTTLTIYDAFAASTTGTVTSGSNVITAMSNVTGLLSQGGDGVADATNSGVFPAGTIVLAVLSSSSIEVSNAATASYTGDSLTFTHYWLPKLSTAKVRITMVAGGGGSGCGGSGATAISGGGTGAGSPWVSTDWIPVYNLIPNVASLPIPVTVGLAGVPCVASSAPGIGGASSFDTGASSLVPTAYPGGAGSNGSSVASAGGGSTGASSLGAGTSASGSSAGVGNRGGVSGGSGGSAGQNGTIYAGSGGSGSPAAGGAGTASGGFYGATAGGSGGGVTALGAAISNGGNGGNNGIFGLINAGTTTGTLPGNAPWIPCHPGAGGGGGASSAAGSAQNGGNAGPGASGGGGGATYTGTVGNAGQSGAGEVCIYEMS